MDVDNMRVEGEDMLEENDWHKQALDSLDTLDSTGGEL